MQTVKDSQFSNWEPSSAYTNSLLTPSIGMTLCASFRDTLLRCEPPTRRCKTFQSRCWWMAVKISFYCNILLSSILGLSWVFFYCSFLKYWSLILYFFLQLLNREFLFYQCGAKLSHGQNCRRSYLNFFEFYALSMAFKRQYHHN